jgi:hypothetical protein
MVAEKQRRAFISYSRVNKEFATKLAKGLREAGYPIWFDQFDIPTGARWDDEIEKSLRESSIFMIILTNASIASENVKDEIGYAIDHGKRILPILLENCEVPLRLRRIQYVDFTTKNFEEGLENAKQLLGDLVDEVSVSIVVKTPAVDSQLGQKAEAESSSRQIAIEVQNTQTKDETKRNTSEEDGPFVTHKGLAVGFDTQKTEELPVQAKDDNEPKSINEVNPLVPQQGEVDRKPLESQRVPSVEKVGQETKKGWLQTWWIRGLISAVVIGIIFTSLGGGGLELWIIWGLFGIVFYPHKTSYIIAAVFIVIFSIFSSLIIGLESAFILGAIVSRFLHVIKKI